MVVVFCCAFSSPNGGVYKLHRNFWPTQNFLQLPREVFWFFFFVGGTGHNKCVGKNVPNDSGAPVKMGATKMQIVEAQELLPHHSQSSSDGILSR